MLWTRINELELNFTTVEKDRLRAEVQALKSELIEFNNESKTSETERLRAEIQALKSEVKELKNNSTNSGAK
ncbi:MAG: hypothetical protein BRC45_16040 [Cyanobacteria bacterium QS_5_48_63]|nr:MAG: hypothetical protein BRC45_16040 [Cyanobacteria bacterium QS_5_48_63]